MLVAVPVSAVSATATGTAARQRFTDAGWGAALALDPIRSSSAGLVPDQGSERMARIGGRWTSCPESYTHRPRQRAPVRRERLGLGGYDDRAF